MLPENCKASLDKSDQFWLKYFLGKEKDQIEDAWTDGYDNSGGWGNSRWYYEKTYGLPENWSTTQKSGS